VPVRIAIRARDLENGTVDIARRDTLEKENYPVDQPVDNCTKLMDEIQANIYKKALDFRTANITKVDTWEEFEAALEKGGFVSAHWDGTTETEVAIKEKTKATIRCIPLGNPLEEGKCILTGKPSKQRVLFAIAY
ncbi:MAG: proline--tRNA ligase, partial [Salinivirgaceae bacterium]|nr:proline--tRNA ligase [Salinivirgaceae bacterium]